MTDHDALLAGIRANPADRVRRWVYADFLEEQGDPRHELVRVCERMREVPVYSDLYWQLKARRNELRPECPADWLAATGYDGSDYDPVFRDGIPNGWRERWRVIREFTERWQCIPMGDIGGQRPEVLQAEQQAGRKLPPSVKEWVAFAHDCSAQNGVLRDGLPRIQTVPGHDALAVYTQAEGDMHWAVRSKLLRRADPPVSLYLQDYDTDTRQSFLPADRDPVADSVAEFSLGYLFVYLDLNSVSGYFSRVENPAVFVRKLSKAMPHKIRFGKLTIFEGENMVVVIGNPAWGSHHELRVNLRQNLPRESIPACLWEQARNGNVFQGCFIPTNNSHAQ